MNPEAIANSDGVDYYCGCFISPLKTPVARCISSKYHVALEDVRAVLHGHQAAAALPAVVAVTCSTTVRALAAAHAEVEAGRAEDHPKLSALRKALIGCRTMTPVR